MHLVSCFTKADYQVKQEISFSSKQHSKLQGYDITVQYYVVPALVYGYPYLIALQTFHISLALGIRNSDYIELKKAYIDLLVPNQQVAHHLAHSTLYYWSP